MRRNKEIRARELRVISSSGEQLGVMPFIEALRMAEDEGLDLVEIVATSSPPVAKVMDYSKYRYDQAKRERENKRSQHVVKIKEIKLRPTTSEHDLEVKLRQGKEFLEKGWKLKISMMFRGREMAHTGIGERLMAQAINTLKEVGVVEVPPKLFGKMFSVILAPLVKKKK